jgi:hypothetical protein
MNPQQSLTVVALLIVVALCCSIVGFQMVTGVPPMSSTAAEGADMIALLKRAGLPEQAVIYELGSGWGSLVIALAHAFPTARIRGIELSPLPYWVSRFRTRNFPNVELRRCDFHRCDLSAAQAVTCFLMTASMPKLAALLDRTLASGTPVVSLCFRFRDRDIEASLEHAGPLRAVALYRWPARGR